MIEKKPQERIWADELVRAETKLPRWGLEKFDAEALKRGMKRSQLVRLIIMEFIGSLK